MIGVQVKGKHLKLFPNSSLTLKFKNPAFVDNDISKVYGQFSVPFSVPLTADNNAVLEFPGLLDNASEMLNESEAIISYNGFPILEGLLGIKSSTKQQCSVSVSADELVSLKTIKLSDLDLGSVDSSNIVDHARVWAYNPHMSNVLFFPVRNKGFYPATDEETHLKGIAHNAWDDETNQFFVDDDHAIATPFIKISHILDRVFAKIGYTLDNQWQIDDELKLLCLYNNKNIYKGLSVPFANPWSNTFDLKDHVPDVLVNVFLKALMGVFNLGIYMDAATKGAKLVPLKQVRSRPAKHNWTYAAEPGYTKTAINNNVSSIGYELSDADALSASYPYRSVPDGDCAFEVGVECYRYQYNDVVRYQYIQDILGNPWYDHVFYQKIFKRVVFGSGAPVLHPISPLYMTDVYDRPLMPEIHISGEDDCGLRMVFYRGMVHGRPLGSNHVYAGTGEPLYQYSLLWNGAEGIYNTWHNGADGEDKIKRVFLLHIRSLINFSFEDLVIVDNVQYVVKSLDVMLKMNGGDRVRCVGELVRVG